jgi:hypothetical protein
MLILQRHSGLFLKQRTWLIRCWSDYCDAWKWDLLMGINIGRGGLSLNGVRKGSPCTCSWTWCWCIVYYFGSCLGVFERDEVWNIGHYLVLSGCFQPFIHCVRNKLASRIQRKLERILGATVTMPWVSKLLMPQIIRLLTLDHIGIFRIRGTVCT